MKKILILPSLLMVLCVSCSKSISKGDLIGEWMDGMFNQYIFHDDGTGRVGNDAITGLRDMNWEMIDDSLFIDDPVLGRKAYQLDSLKKEERGGQTVDVLYVSYTAKEHLYTNPGHFFNFEGAYDSFLKRVAEGYLATKDGHNWLQSKQGLEWQETEDGKQWLATEEGKEFVRERDATIVLHTKWFRE